MASFGRQGLAQLLRDEARESWDYFISDQIVYVAQLKGAKSSVAPYRWVRDYVEGSFWFEVILYSRLRKNPLAVWLIESGSQNLGLRGAHSKAHQAFDGDDKSVFIDAREFIEDSEQFEFRPLRSVIWLKGLDGIDCGGENALADTELSRDVPKGKRDTAFVVGGEGSLGYLRLPLGKSPSDVIQGRPKLVTTSPIMRLQGVGSRGLIVTSSTTEPEMGCPLSPANVPFLMTVISGSVVSEILLMSSSMCIFAHSTLALALPSGCSGG